MFNKCRLSFFVIVLLFFLCFNGYAGTIFLKDMGKTELEMEFDLYYMPLGWYIPLTSSAMEKINIKKEEKIYKYLFKNLFAFRFIVLEVSAYPMPIVGVVTKKYARDFYNSAKVTDNFNIIESITSSGFKEPWAFSLFIGNVMKFETEHTEKRETLLNKEVIDHDGKGYSGLLFTYGNFHIKDNELVRADWTEIEFKIKAQKYNDNQNMYINYKLGTKLFLHDDIKSLAYIGINRDRIDYDYYVFSLKRNSHYEIRFDFDIKRWDLIQSIILIGKTFPLRSTKLIVPQFSLGILWEFNDPYKGELADPDFSNNIKFLIRPNIRF